MPSVLITGSNRGLGREFARQYAAAGWRVFATCRNPAQATDLRTIADRHPQVSLHALDVTDAASVSACATELAGQALDLLLLNSAWLAPQRGQRLDGLDWQFFARSFEVNATGPMRVLERFLPLVERGGQKKIVFLGSAASSNGLLRPPVNLYAYRSSKAATHLLARSLALDLAPRGVHVGLVNPGLADTRGLLTLGPDDKPPEDMAPIVALVRAGVIQLITAEEAVRGMIRVIDRLDASSAGQFINYDGSVLPW